MLSGVSLEQLAKITEGIKKREDLAKDEKPAPIGEVSPDVVSAIKDGLKQLGKSRGE
jgi:hypothetical protein